MGEEEEARRAMEIAEKKLSENDFDGAKNFINKAQRLYPNLDGLKQVSMMIDVYKSAEESDWYGILGVDPLADEEAVKKTYKQLALLLHPDKNKFDGAEGAFKLVLEAWCFLSDKVKRASYDQKRRNSNETKTHMQKGRSSGSTEYGSEERKEARSRSSGTEYASEQRKEARSRSSGTEYASEQRKEARSRSSSTEYASEQRQTSDFWTNSIWTMCNRCKTEWLYFNLTTDFHKAKLCPNCGHQTYFAVEKTPKALNKRRTSIDSQQQKQWSGVQSKTTTEKRTTNYKASEQKQEWIAVQDKASIRFALKCSSVSNCGSAANQKSKRRLEEFAPDKILKKARTFVNVS